MEVPPLALFLVVPMIICIAALPITPSGLGVRENLFVHPGGSGHQARATRRSPSRCSPTRAACSGASAAEWFT